MASSDGTPSSELRGRDEKRKFSLDVSGPPPPGDPTDVGADAVGPLGGRDRTVNRSPAAPLLPPEGADQAGVVPDTSKTVADRHRPSFALWGDSGPDVEKSITSWRHAPEKSGPERSFIQTFTICFAMMCGGGMTMIPGLPVMVGLMPAILLVILVGIASVETARVLHFGWHLWNEAYGGTYKLNSYAEIGRACYGSVGAGTFQILSLALLLGLGGAHMLIIGSQVRPLFPFVDVDYRLPVLIILPVLWVLIMLRDFTALTLSPVAAISGMVSCIAICWKAYGDFQERDEADVSKALSADVIWSNGNFATVGGACSLILGLFGIHNIVPNLISDMKDTSLFFAAFTLAVVVGGLLYISVMILAWIAWGNDTQDELVLTSYAGKGLGAGVESDLVCKIASAAIALNMLVSYPIVQVFLFDSMYAFDFFAQFAPKGSARGYIMRTIMLLLNFGIATTTERYSNVFLLFSSMLLPFLSFHIPIVCVWKIRRKLDFTHYGRESAAVWFVHGSLLIFATFCFIAGTVNGLLNYLYGRQYWLQGKNN